MSTGDLSERARSTSQAAIRKRLVRSQHKSLMKEISKSSTMTSFYKPKFQKLLQAGKIEQIMNSDPHSKANLYYTTHINQMEKELGSTKKSLSTMVMKAKAKEYNINKLKSDIAKIEREQGILMGQSEFNRTKFSSANDKFGKKKEDVEEKAWAEKSYKHMKFRLDKDSDFLRSAQEQYQRGVVELQKTKKFLQTEYYNRCQLQKKLEFNYNRAREISKEQTDEKNQFIELLNMEMAEKDLLNDMKIAKNQREKNINDLAVSVIEKEELQKYLQILFTHKIVSQILKNKSQKLIEEFSLVQNAFLHIRSNTNITDMSKVLERMESQDKEYESLLKKVNLLEQELLGMDGKMEQAVKRQHQILSKGGKDDEAKDLHHYHGIEKDQYEKIVREKKKLKDRKNDDQILRQKILLWVGEHCEFFGIDNKASSDEAVLEVVKTLAQTIKSKMK